MSQMHGRQRVKFSPHEQATNGGGPATNTQKGMKGGVWQGEPGSPVCEAETLAGRIICHQEPTSAVSRYHVSVASPFIDGTCD